MFYPSAPRLALADPACLDKMRAARGNPISWPPMLLKQRLNEERTREEFLKIFGNVNPPAAAPRGEIGLAHQNLGNKAAFQAAFRINLLPSPGFRRLKVSVRAGALYARLVFMEGFTEWGLKDADYGEPVRVEWRRGNPPSGKDLMKRVAAVDYSERLERALTSALAEADDRWRR